MPLLCPDDERHVKQGSVRQIRDVRLSGLAPMLTKHVTVLTVVAGLAVVGLNAATRRQFAGRADIVRVYATVRDKSGHLITDLREEEFEVRDRGTRVPIAAFSSTPEPISACVLVDMSGALFDDAAYEVLRTAILRFIDGLGPADRAMVGRFSAGGEIRLSQLTLDHGTLANAVADELTPAPPGRGLLLMTAVRVRPLWNAIAAAMKALDGQPGRKVVVVLANGPNTGTLPKAPGLPFIKETIPSDAFTIYGVTDFETRWANGVRPAEDVIETTTLEQLVELTGGGFFRAPAEPRNLRVPLTPSLIPLMADVAEELRRQYTLGFLPVRRDGKVSKVEVKVSRRDMRVWARKTYRAPAAP